MTHSPSSAQSEKVAPCPFCGCKIVGLGYIGQPAREIYAICYQCKATGPSQEYQTGMMFDFDATWNRRAAASAHPIGEDAANVAMGEREAFERWITTECNYDPVDMVTQPGGEVYVLAGVQEAWDAWMGSVEARAAAPQGLTDEQIHERVLLACHSDPVSFTGQYVLTLDEIRALLTAAQPASSLAEGGERE